MSKFIFNGNFTKDEDKDLWIQDSFTGAKDSMAHETGDVSSSEIYNPRKVRWFNSFEFAQQIRYMVALNWMREHFVKLSKKNKKRRQVLDLGCSYSFLYNFWRSNGNYFGWPKIHYHGVDANIKRIQKGRETFVPKRNDILTYYLADVTKPIALIKELKVDIIVCMETIEHLPKKKVPVLMKNIRKNLKKDGIIIMSSPNPKKEEGENFVWKDSQKGHIYEWGFDEIYDLYKEEGLKVIDYCGILPVRNYRNKTVHKDIGGHLSDYLPFTVVNNILCLLDHPLECSKQWMFLLRKEQS